MASVRLTEDAIEFYKHIDDEQPSTFIQMNQNAVAASNTGFHLPRGLAG